MGLAWGPTGGRSWARPPRRLRRPLDQGVGVLADRLDADKPLTPRLVERAREEFDATVARLADIPPGQVTSAIRTTEIAWEIEKLQKKGEAA